MLLAFVNVRSYNVVDPVEYNSFKNFRLNEPGGCFFGTGTTVAVFQRSGSLSSLSELLEIAVTDAANRCA